MSFRLYTSTKTVSEVYICRVLKDINFQLPDVQTVSHSVKAAGLVCYTGSEHTNVR